MLRYHRLRARYACSKQYKEYSNEFQSNSHRVGSDYLQYVFEGIGQLISTILIGCAEHIQRINDNGVKKMCRNVFAIQKTLSDITNHPEQSMDHARQFYELFTLSPEVTIHTNVYIIE